MTFKARVMDFSSLDFLNIFQAQRKTYLFTAI